ncbi:glycosyltransferase family 2 protein [Nocardioides korecus]
MSDLDPASRRAPSAPPGLVPQQRSHPPDDPAPTASSSGDAATEHRQEGPESPEATLEFLNHLRPADDGPASDPLSCAVTVVVPTRDEVGNIAPLVARITRAMAGDDCRILFVDDSEDGTPLEVVRVAALSHLSVDLIHRDRSQRVGGLGGAVLVGLRAARTPWAVVMDGDLQHPPELVPALIATGLREHAEVVVASRRVPGGSSQGLASFGRAVVSSSSTALSKLVFPGNLRGISDPMSGFFAVRLDAVDLDALEPRGFKILLELLAREGQVTEAEVPFTFGVRHSGESKASLGEGATFVRRLVALRIAETLGSLRRSGRLVRGTGFAAVGLTGLLVNVAVMWLLADPRTLHLNYLAAAVATTQVASSWNFVLVDRLVYRGRKRLTPLSRYLASWS